MTVLFFASVNILGQQYNYLLMSAILKNVIVVKLHHTMHNNIVSPNTADKRISNATDIHATDLTKSGGWTFFSIL